MHSAFVKVISPTEVTEYSDTGTLFWILNLRDNRTSLLREVSLVAYFKKGVCVLRSWDNGVPLTPQGGVLQEMRVMPLGTGLQGLVSNYVELLG